MKALRPVKAMIEFCVNRVDTCWTRFVGELLPFLFLVILTLPLASVAEPTCPILFSSSHHTTALRPVESKADGLARLDEVIRSGYSAFPERSIWLEYPLQEPQTQELVEALIQLDPAQQREARIALKQRPPRDPHLAQALSLALYDFKAWNAFVTRFTSGPLLDESLVNSLVPVLRNMPQDLRDQLLARIRVLYPHLGKRNVRIVPFRRELRLAPKRAADVFIQHTLKTDEWLSDLNDQIGDPLKAYDAYLAGLKARLFADLENGRYNAADVLTVGRAIQEQLRTNAKGFANPTIWVTGSFPNGRAKLNGADLDSQLSDRRLTKLFSKMDRAINKALRKRHPNADLHLEAMRPTTTPHFAAEINPIFLRVSTTSIEIEVYPMFQRRNRDSTLMPFNYARPKRYLLEGEASDAGETSSALQLSDESAASPSTSEKAPSTRSILRKALRKIPRPTRWMDNPYSEPQTQTAVEEILRLNSLQRQVAIEYLKSQSIERSVDQVLRLALYDRVAWDEYFEEISTKPQGNDALYNALAPVLSRMPRDLKSELFSKINRAYPTASRVKYVREFPFFLRRYLKLAPKRALDVLISHLSGSAARIRAFVGSGRSANLAYEAVLREQKQAVFSNLPQGSYTAQDILTAAREIQSVMREKEGSESWTVTMAGSFPSGRADVEKSDIDVMLSDQKYKRHLKTMTGRVNAALQAKGDHLRRANLEVHPMFETTTTVNAAIVSPLLVRISADRIELMAFDPIRNRERDDYQIPENYPAPDVYLLESSETQDRTEEKAS